jgi:hypothetical protein
MTTDNKPGAYVEFDEQNSAALNRFELTSVRALLSFAAHHQKVDEAVIKEIVQTHFSVDDVTKLPSRSYDEVVRFLVDMQIDMLLN